MSNTYLFQFWMQFIFFPVIKYRLGRVSQKLTYLLFLYWKQLRKMASYAREGEVSLLGAHISFLIICEQIIAGRRFLYEIISVKLIVKHLPK